MHTARVPRDLSSTRASALTGPAPVVLITTARCTSATTIKELWRNKVYNSLRIDTWQGLGEREKEDLGLCLYWAASGMPRVLWVYSLLKNLKQKNRN